MQDSVIHVWQSLSPLTITDSLRNIPSRRTLHSEKPTEGGTYVYLWLIHVDIWQKLTKFCKATILQLKTEKKLILPRPHTLRNEISDSKLKSIGIFFFFYFHFSVWGIFLPYDSELSFHYNRNWKCWILSFLDAIATKTSQDTCSKLWLRDIHSGFESN